jgi:ribosomal protein L31E
VLSKRGAKRVGTAVREVGTVIQRHVKVDVK